MTEWTLDGSIRLETLCREANWHMATAIEALKAKGIESKDAEDFISFVFADEVGEDADAYISFEQDARLSVE